MQTVECPKCTLRFEPDDTTSAARTDVFCPQCGHRFAAESRDEGLDDLALWQTA
jgi:DNA-directed RNA polymerase subunit RPC12/RpoP